MGVDLGVVSQQFQVDVAWVEAAGRPLPFPALGRDWSYRSGEVQYLQQPREQE